MRIRWLAAAMLLVVGVGAVGLVVFDPVAGQASSTQYITTAARQTDVVKSAVATGTVQPTATYGLAFGSDPQLVTSASSSGSGSGSGGSGGSGGGSTTWLVTQVKATVGAKVSKGDVLASADAGDAKAQLAAAQAQLTAAQAKLAADQGGGTTQQKQSAAAQVSAAQLQLTNAENSAANTAAQNSLSLSQALAAVTRAQNQLNADETASPSVPANVITQDQNALQAAQDSLSTTRLRVQASNQQAAASVSQARLSVSQAQTGYSAALAPAQAAQIASDQAAIATNQSAVTAAQARVDAATLRAPADGVVIAIGVQAGFDAPSGYAVELQSSGMQVVASFTETDLPSLAVGQAADITINATSQQATGTVAAITPTAATAGSGTSVVTYSVDIALDQVPPATTAGMTAQVSVTTASVTGAIAVPPIAISGTAGNYSVQVVGANGQVETVPVQVGLIGTSLAQVTAGLSAGERVVVGTSSARSGTGTTSGLGGLGGGGLRGISGTGGGGFQFNRGNGGGGTNP